MPTYDYSCSHCGWVGDLYVSVDDRDLVVCPNDSCRLPLTRLFSPPRAKHAVGSLHRSRYAKDHDLIELGNEKPETVQKEFARAREEAEDAMDRQVVKDVTEEIEANGWDSYQTTDPTIIREQESEPEFDVEEYSKTRREELTGVSE